MLFFPAEFISCSHFGNKVTEMLFNGYFESALTLRGFDSVPVMHVIIGKLAVVEINKNI
jgi:hypothetical protein